MTEGAFDRGSGRPMFEQVASELRRAIANGEVKPGERLPPSVDLAAVMAVNRNTVLRALRILREEGIVEFRRGRGVTVADAGPGRSAVLSRVRDLVAFARRHGYGPDEVARMIETAQ